MTVRTIVYIVASPRPRVGKTLLARLLTDFQLQNGRPVEAYDLSPGEGSLSAFLPNHASAAAIDTVKDQMALFDRLVADDAVSKIVDLGSPQYDAFFRIAGEIGFAEETRRRGIAAVIAYIGTPDRTSVEAFAALRALYRHGSLVPVFNELLGNSQFRAKFPPSGTATVSVHLPALAPALRRVVEQPPFSFFETPAALSGVMSLDAHLELQQWVRRVFLEFREMELNILLSDLQSALRAQS